MQFKFWNQAIESAIPDTNGYWKCSIYGNIIWIIIILPVKQHICSFIDQDAKGNSRKAKQVFTLDGTTRWNFGLLQSFILLSDLDTTVSLFHFASMFQCNEVDLIFSYLSDWLVNSLDTFP